MEEDAPTKRLVELGQALSRARQDILDIAHTVEKNLQETSTEEERKALYMIHDILQEKATDMLTQTQEIVTLGERVWRKSLFTRIK